MSEPQRETPQARIDRWTNIHAFQSSEYLGRQVAQLEAIRDWLVKRHDINGWCSCGHMEMVHHGGGCTGLIGSDDDWRSCRCGEYCPRPERACPCGLFGISEPHVCRTDGWSDA